MKENQRITLTRRLLREAMLDLLGEMPIEKINVSLLCRTAGINRTTFYHHYTTAQDVLADAEAEIIAGIEAALAASPVRSPHDALVRICTYLYAHADILRILFRCNVDAQLEGVIRETNRHLLERECPPHPEPFCDTDSVQLTATFLGTGMYYLIRHWLLEEIDKPPEAVASLILTILRPEQA